MPRRIDLVILCDTDPDRPDYGGRRYDEAGPLIWRGVQEGISRLCDELSGITDDAGRAVPITWLLRADTQIATCHDDAGWLLQRFGPLWKELTDQGHALGWHPHHWRWSDEKGCWYQEIHDAGWQRENLTQGAEAFTSLPAVSRGGWHFMDTTTMNALEDHGVKLDMSAMPGMCHGGGPDARGSHFIGQYDWTRCKQMAYRPHPRDYQAHDLRQEGILELPCTTVQSGMLLRLLKLRYRLRGSASQKMGIASSVNITAHPLLFAPMIDQAFAQAEIRQNAILAATFHPDELLGAGPKIFGMPIYRVKHVGDNLRALVHRARKRNVEIRFISAENMIDPLATRFRHAHEHAMETRTLQADQIQQSIALSQEVFDPENRDLDFSDRLGWKYEHFGDGAPLGRLALDGDRLMGQYVAVPKRVWWQGSETRSAYSCDTAVRSCLRGTGLSTLLARKQYDDLRDKDLPFVWGFPNSNSRNLFFFGLAWREIAPFPFLLRPLNAGAVIKVAMKKSAFFRFLAPIGANLWNLFCRIQNPSPNLTLVPIEQFGPEADELWTDLRGRVGIAAVRDKQALNHRYANGPGFPYDRFLVQKNSEMIGLVVTRRMVKRGLDVVAICECILGSPYLNAMQDTLALLLRKARTDGADAVGACCFAHQPERRAYLRNRFIPVPLRLQPEPTYFGAYPLNLDAQAMQLFDAGRWYISWGDQDTV